MQKMLGLMRKAITEFDLIEDGDHIAVGVSGGKDSMVLLNGLHLLRRFIGIDYDITAVSIDLQFQGIKTDFETLQTFCKDLAIPFVLKNTQIGEVVFSLRKEEHPCSLCARMRRGALHDLAKENGCNKVALGHHFDDAIETFMMNLFIEGRIGCFSPRSYLSRKDLTVIRPMALAPEKEIIRAANRAGLPIVKNPCPVDGATARQKMKNLLNTLEESNQGVKQRIFGAMRRAGVDGWQFRV
mgnify:CR=1 FL=1